MYIDLYTPVFLSVIIHVTSYIVAKVVLALNIRDIAKLAGVSSTTVSRVINQSGYVKQETRELIESLIQNHNYTPSAVARSLSKQDTSSIGVIIPDIGNPFFSGVIRGISTMAEQNNFNLLYFDTNEQPMIEHRFLKTVKEQRLKGLIITPTSNLDRTTKEYLENLEQSGIPVVLVDRDLQGSEFDGVFVENKQGAIDAVNALCDAGHTKIAIIAGPETSKPGRDRLRGYLDALSFNHCDIREEYIKRGDFKIEKGYSLTQKLLTMQDPPTAIFCSNNAMALGCLKYLYENNIQLGKDIALISFDEIPILDYVGFQLSVVQRAVSEMGSTAMEILLERLNRPRGKSEVKRVVFPTQLILKGSEKKLL